jgi:hypothetical protein
LLAQGAGLGLGSIQGTEAKFTRQTFRLLPGSRKDDAESIARWHGGIQFLEATD